MIGEPTVLVLGAGASFPYGFPVGKRLIENIVDGLRGADLLAQPFPPPKVTAGVLVKYLEWCRHSFAEMASFKRELVEAGPRSIDVFLANRDEFMEIGKRAIAATLISCEQPEKLKAIDTESPPASGKCTWYQYLFEQMDRSEEEFETAPLKIITFNYDRSLEYFLFDKLKAHFGVSDERAIELIQTKPILHIHGQLGRPLFLAQAEDSRNFTPATWANRGVRGYDQEVHSGKAIMACADMMAIIPDKGNKGDVLEEAWHLIAEARILCFLGFAYHPENVKLLEVDKHFKGPRLLGSGFRLGRNEKRQAMNRFMDRGPRELKFHRGFSREDHHQRILIGDNRMDSLTFLKEYPVFD